MNYPQVNRLKMEKVLFVWDGTKQAVKIADKFASSSEDMLIHAINVMPHESISAYRTAGYTREEPSLLERRLDSAFKKAASRTRHLRHANLEILFGDRVQEIVRLADVIKSNHILAPRFVQSRFSIWIHGDLNKRIELNAPCRVTFYDPSSVEGGVPFGENLNNA